MVVRRALNRCVDRGLALGWGVDLPVLGLTQTVVWADNIYFSAHDVKVMTQMCQDFTDVLTAMRLRWKPESSTHLVVEIG